MFLRFLGIRFRMDYMRLFSIQTVLVFFWGVFPRVVVEELDIVAPDHDKHVQSGIRRCSNSGNCGNGTA